jgi:hypothetical protein
MIFFDWVSPVGVARPVKVDITCLSEPPSMMVSARSYSNLSNVRTM